EFRRVLFRSREIVENVTAVIAIELLTALTALRHRLTSLRRDGTYHPLTEVALGRGTQAVWAALQDAAPELFEIPLDRDVIYYPYLRRMIEVVQSGALVEAVREAGIPFYSVRSSTELVVPEGYPPPGEPATATLGWVGFRRETVVGAILQTETTKFIRGRFILAFAHSRQVSIPGASRLPLHPPRRGSIRAHLRCALLCDLVNPEPRLNVAVDLYNRVRRVRPLTSSGSSPRPSPSARCAARCPCASRRAAALWPRLASLRPARRSRRTGYPSPTHTRADPQAEPRSRSTPSC